MGDINKDELQLMLQVITKNTEQAAILIEKNLQLANKIQELQAEQTKTNSRLYNGMAKEISEAVIAQVKECNSTCGVHHKNLNDSLKEFMDKCDEVKKSQPTEEKIKNIFDNSSIAKSINVLTVIMGAIGFVIITAVVVIKVIDSREVSAFNKAVVGIEAIKNGDK